MNEREPQSSQQSDGFTGTATLKKWFIIIHYSDPKSCIRSLETLYQIREEARASNFLKSAVFPEEKFFLKRR